jgi:dihydrodipicolinate synthase/N-acetylneuraminate lyase
MNPVPADGVIHPVYLPFSEQKLASHFAQVASSDPGDHLAYYRTSAARAGE